MHFFLRHPRFVISAITILTIFLGAFIPFMELDNEVTRMIPADDPHKTFFDQTHEKFGLSNTVIVGIVSQDSVFRSDLLEKASFFCDTFETLKNVSDLLSVSRTNYIEGDSMGLVVGPLFETMPHTGPEMQEFKRRVFGWEVFRNSLVSEDGKALIIGIRYPKQRIVNGINQRLSDLEKLELYTSIRKIIDANPIPHAHLYVAGEPAVISLITKQMQHDIAMLVPLVFIVVVILLLLSIGNIGGVCLILSSITISLIWTMGLMSLLGIRMSLISTSIPVLLVAIGSAYAIHIIHRYYHERTNGLGREEALNTTLSNVGVAVLMAALTTMAGFRALVPPSLFAVKGIRQLYCSRDVYRACSLSTPHSRGTFRFSGPLVCSETAEGNVLFRRKNRYIAPRIYGMGAASPRFRTAHYHRHTRRIRVFGNAPDVR